MKFRVLITDRFDTEAEAHLASFADCEITHSRELTPTAEELRNVDGLIIRSRTKVDRALLANAPQLKVIVTCTSGFDHVDFVALNEASQKSDLKMMYTPNANAASACELTWALVLACARKIPAAHRAVKSGEWRREELTGVELRGKTYGIIGLGRIGSRVAQVARAFGMKILAFDPYKDDAYFAQHGAERVSLDELFMLSQVVSVHVPGTADTHHMIKPLILEDSVHDVLFVNTSRGSVIDESLLLSALDHGHFAAAGLDVFEREPLQRHSPLISRDDVVLSPHVGAATSEAFRAASMEAAQKMQVFAKTGSLSDSLPPDEIWMSVSFRAP